MPPIFGLTGTPGTGKKSVAPLAARELGVDAISLLELARIHGAASKAGGEVEVDTKLLSKRLLASPPGASVVYGHLLPYCFPPSLISRVCVMRTDPLVLKKRLTGRRYQAAKVTENVEAELIGVVSADAYGAFGARRVSEVDTTGVSAGDAAASVVAFLRDRRRTRRRIDWTLGYATGPRLRSLFPKG